MFNAQLSIYKDRRKSRAMSYNHRSQDLCVDLMMTLDSQKLDSFFKNIDFKRNNRVENLHKNMCAIRYKEIGSVQSKHPVVSC